MFTDAPLAHAHCDLYCGVYDPAQAMIEAMSCLKIAKKYADSDDEVFRARCIILKDICCRHSCRRSRRISPLSLCSFRAGTVS